MRLRAVFFDAGNTLIRLDYDVIAQALALEGIDVESSAVRRAECRARVRLDPLLADRSTEGDDVFRAYTRFAFEGLGAPSEAAERALARLHDRARDLWRIPDPQAFWVLEALRGRGYRLGVISNSNGTVEALLKQAGLAPFLDVILDSGRVGVEKPDPRIFRMALETVGARPQEAVHIGDLYSVDIVGAKGAGLHAILLDPIGAWGDVNCLKARDLIHAQVLIELL